MRKILPVIAVLFLFISTAGKAQRNNFKSFGVENGLPQNTIYSLIQDSRGYIWAGTDGGGVAIYDGQEFNVINKKKGLANNTVRALFEDSRGNVWMGTGSGITQYDGKRFTNYVGGDNIPNASILVIYEDSRGILWFGTASGGLIKGVYNAKDSVEFTNYTMRDGYNNEEDSLAILNSNFIFDIVEDSQNKLWLICYQQGVSICTIDDEGDITAVDNMYPPADFIVSGAIDEQGNIWLGTKDAGALKILKSTDDQAATMTFYDTSDGLKSNYIWDILTDERGNVWFATIGGGVSKYDGKRFYSFTTNDGLPDNQISCLLQDSESNIWFGTMSNGLCKLVGEYFSHFSQKEGLPSNKVFSISQDQKGDMWIATLGGGISKLSFDKFNVPLFKNFNEKNGLPSDYIKSIDFDKNNNLWIATAADGFCSFDGEKFTSYDLSTGGFDVSNSLNCIIADSKGKVWCGTTEGILIYDGNGYLEVTQDNDFQLINDEVQTIIEDSKGNIWAGTLGGLVKFHDKKFATDFDEDEGLNDKMVFSLAEDPAGNIWIGTFGGGIYKINTDKDPNTISFVMDDSLLSSNNIYSMTFFDRNTLIVGTDRGFDRVILDPDFNILTVKYYSQTDGFIGLENNLNAIYKDRANKIWFGTVKGLTVYDPSIEKVDSIAPYTHITGMKMFFQDYDWSTRSDSIRPWFATPYGLELMYNENHLTFRFSGISMTNPDKVLFKYQLEGLETNWSPPRKENEVFYSGLAPGEYTFKVMAMNENGIWTEEPAAIHFVINPPFWKTTWFILTCSGILILLVVLYIKLRERKLVRDKMILEQMVKERTREIEQQKEEIEAQRDEIEHQRDQIEIQLEVTEQQRDKIVEQQKEIMDSIHYAKRIQNAILPPVEPISKSIADHFILFKPRDIVSGDFYWSSKRGNLIVIAAADCTGHGVPGAFMSMLGVSFLNEIVIEKGVSQPSKILNLLRIQIINALQQKGEEGEAKDGMDLALITIDTENNKVEFAGANNPLYLIRNNELTEIKGDKMPVAIHIRMEKFTNHIIETQPGDTFYVFSDGFADQFGGPDGKKFKSKQFKDILLSIQDEKLSAQRTILDETIEGWMRPENGSTEEHYEQIDDIVIIGARV